MVQEVVWGVSIVLMGALAATFAWVAIGANVALADYGPVVASAYRLRTWLFGLAVIILIGANYETLGKLPYVLSMSAPPATSVLPAEAVAEQWTWSIKPNAFRVGETVDFHVTSKDVNHGFAIYDPDMRIVAQTQAMPGYVNVLRYTFREPGVYQVLCLEYCGLGHHEMAAEIKVAALSGASLEDAMTVQAVQSRSGISARAAVLAYIAVSGLVLLLMMLLGLTMRLAQAQWIHIQPDFFYVIMTMHGAGMVGIAGVSGAAVMWYFVRRHVPVSTGVFVANLVFFLIGAVLILGAGFIGEFAAGWTFLFPLPAHGVIWSANAAASYMVGLLFIGVGFLLLHLDIARGILSIYGGLGAALGVKQAFGLAPEDQGPPPAVTASTMVLIVNILGILLGAAVLVVSLVNLYAPSFTFNALAAKNMIYFFGHVFINATIYMAVIAVYEILPVFTHRKWKTNRAFYFAWVLSTVMVLTVYTHHLFMDFAMPTWALIAGQIISWLSGLPVLLVTAFGALTNVYRSGIRWTVAAGLAFVGVAGWAIGVIPAIADGTIEVNSFMHNTQWVPGHFHTYLLLGTVAMFFGFMTYIGPRTTGALAPIGFWLYVVGGSVFVLSFLAAGSVSVPRRYAVHLAEWLPYDRVGSIGAAVTVLGALILVLNFVIGLPSTLREAEAAR